MKNLKKWYIYGINESDGNILKDINISNNPTVNSAELVIQPNSLEYGLYKFVYKIKMLDGLEDFQKEIYHYIKIVPSGIVVRTLANGMFSISRGLEQSISLNPLLYSYDLDEVILMDKLKFNFYCSVVQSGILVKQPFVGFNRKIDLLSLKNEPYLFSNEISCFNSTNSYFWIQLEMF